MTFLVVGGAGYIGSVVAEQLLAAGKRVVVLDNLSTGHRAAVPEGATFVQRDMSDRDLVRSLLRKHAVSCVMHFSARSIVPESLRQPLLYYQNNVTAGVALVESMLEVGVKRMIFSSTAAVYGEPDIIPIVEDAPTRPTTPYGRTKLCFEEFLADCSEAYGLRYVSLRYFNAAGASGRRGEDHRPETHLIPLVLEVARGKRPAIEIFGDDYPTPDGTCIRDYIHALDLAEAHLLAAEFIEGNDSSRIYNLGNGQGFSVREVIEKAREVTGRQIACEIAPRRPGDPPVLVASSERISRELGWTPRYPALEQIIASAWKWRLAFPDGYGA
jgi:UDP-glucose 4-epimerase